MSNIDKRLSETLVKPTPESSDPAYLAWRDQQVREAQAQVQMQPNSLIPLKDAMQKYGLEY